MRDLRLAWILARRGTGIRRWGMVLASSIGVVLVTLLLALPDAYLNGSGAQADRLVLSIVGIFLLVPVGVLLLAVSRLSAATKDRRLAALRILGLSPRRTRLVTAAENGILALGGGVVGVVAGIVLGRVLSPPLLDAGILQRPLVPPPLLAVAVAALIVVLTSVIALAPTRHLAMGAMNLRRTVGGHLSWWRLLPLTAGVVGAGILLTMDPPGSGELGERFFVASMACVIAAAVGVLLALPLATRGLAEVLSNAQRPALRMAGRRMQVDPSATARVISGLAISLFLVTGATGALSAFQNTPQYLAEKQSLESGPQLLPMLGGPNGEVTTASINQVQAIEGVLRVVPRYPVSIAAVDAQRSVSNVFVGSCADLTALYDQAQGCRDDRVSWLHAPLSDAPIRPPADLTSPVRLENGRRPASGGGSSVKVTPSSTVIELPQWSWYGVGGMHQDGLFVPLGTPGLSSLHAVPFMAYVVTGPGYEVRNRLAATGLVDLGGLQTYQATNAWSVAVWAMLALALSVGLVAVLVTAIDRAIERRKEMAAQVAMGVPARTLRVSQSIQVAAPTGLAVLGAILTGYLSTAAFLHSASPLLQTMPIRTIGIVLSAAVIAVVIVAAATLTGISSRLTPELLRHE